MQRSHVGATPRSAHAVAKRQAGYRLALRPAHVAARPLRPQPVGVTEIRGAARVCREVLATGVDFFAVGSARGVYLRDLPPR